MSCQFDSGIEPNRCVEKNFLKALIDYEERAQASENWQTYRAARNNHAAESKTHAPANNLILATDEQATNTKSKEQDLILPDNDLRL